MNQTLEQFIQQVSFELRDEDDKSRYLKLMHFDARCNTPAKHTAIDNMRRELSHAA